MGRRPPRSSLFPYSAPFRSATVVGAGIAVVDVESTGASVAGTAAADVAGGACVAVVARSGVVGMHGAARRRESVRRDASALVDADAACALEARAASADVAGA